MLNDVLKIIGFATIIVFLVSSIVYPLVWKSCMDQTIDFESRYGFFTECQVKVNDRWINWENYNGMIIDDENNE